MALSWKARRRLSIFILIVALPAYIVAAVSLVALFERPPFWLELVIYVALGVVWAFPLKAVFKGVGQADPDAGKKPDSE
jgi:membrane protein implicated in regulation of membrane protease activity